MMYKAESLALSLVFEFLCWQLIFDRAKKWLPCTLANGASHRPTGNAFSHLSTQQRFCSTLNNATSIASCSGGYGT